MNRTPTILMLGSRSDFSAIVLSHLARAGIARLCAVVLKSAPAAVVTASPSFTVSVSDPLSQAAKDCETPLHTLEELADIQSLGRHPDLIVTACFPRRLPPALLEHSRLGCLNVHPSLLPAYRGPSPVFWQLRADERMSGVTIHKLSDELDAGDIVASDTVMLLPEMTAKQINLTLVEAGARLLVRTLKHNDWRRLPGTAQDPAKASYFSWPAAGDFRITRHWSAQRAYRFMRGTLEWGHTYELDVDNERLILGRALAYDAAGRMPVAWARDADTARIALNPGVLHASLRDVLVIPGR